MQNFGWAMTSINALIVPRLQCSQPFLKNAVMSSKQLLESQDHPRKQCNIALACPTAVLPASSGLIEYTALIHWLQSRATIVPSAPCI